MQFYTKQHQTYCEIDLHVRTMSVCILNQAAIFSCLRTCAEETEKSLQGGPSAPVAGSAQGRGCESLKGLAHAASTPCQASFSVPK
jgi:hypothetical protein